MSDRRLISERDAEIARLKAELLEQGLELERWKQADAAALRERLAAAEPLLRDFAGFEAEYSDYDPCGPDLRCCHFCDATAEITIHGCEDLNHGPDCAWVKARALADKERPHG